MLYLCNLRLEFYKTIVIFEISTLKFVISDSLTHAVSFSVGSIFSKDPGSTFSEGPGPGLGPLYKVCHVSPIFLKKADTISGSNSSHQSDWLNTG